MMRFTGRGIVLDIEGTVAPIAYVTEVLFPFARQHLADFLARRRGDAALREALALVAADAGAGSFREWAGDAGEEEQRRKLIAHLHNLMDADAKATGLKAVQGLIWEEGYRSGQLRSVLFPDVPAALRAWHARGVQLLIYSSGSVAAQRVFFAHTTDGDLTPLFAGYHDTTTGPKREAASYERITAAMGLPAGEVLFVSDVVAELAAAARAGLRTALAVRPGNAPVGDAGRHPVIASLLEIELI
jgi:enolase-phosphatase E1